MPTFCGTTNLCSTAPNARTVLAQSASQLLTSPLRAGILLGPSGLGQQYPCPTGSTGVTSLYPHGAPCDARNPTLILFPTFTPFQAGPNNIRNYLGVCAQIGVVLFMFVVGLEVDLQKMRQTSAKAVVIAAASVTTPFIAGTFALGPYLYKKHNDNDSNSGAPVSALAFNLVVGTCLSVTAFPVLARIITEQKLQKLRLGSATLACAALNDVVAWTLLAVVLAVQKSSSNGGAVEFAPVLIELAWLVLIIVVQFLVVGPLMRLTVFNHYVRTGNLSNNRLAWTLINMFLSAWLLHKIGFHSMIGSFVFGLVFPRGQGTPFLYNVLNKIEPFTTLVLLPLFFMTTGLSVNLSMLNQAGLDLLWVLIVASGGKFFGSAISARLVGFNNRHSVAMGVMMNTRGLTEIVLLNVAKQAGIINDLMFAILVMMAIITTASASPVGGASHVSLCSPLTLSPCLYPQWPVPSCLCSSPPSSSSWSARRTWRMTQRSTLRSTQTGWTSPQRRWLSSSTISTRRVVCWTRQSQRWRPA